MQNQICIRFKCKDVGLIDLIELNILNTNHKQNINIYYNYIIYNLM